MCTDVQLIYIPESVSKISSKAFEHSKSVQIYCEVMDKPSGWDSEWNTLNRPVFWGYSLDRFKEIPWEENKYNVACDCMLKNTILEYGEAIKIFESISYYKDSMDRIEECRKMIERLETKAEEERLAQIQLKKEEFIKSCYFEIIGEDCILTMCDDKSIKIAYIPEEYNNHPVTAINEHAFARCEKLVRVIIPDSVKIIGAFAFQKCTLLQDVKMSNSVTRIEKGAFEVCKSLKNITIPNTVTYIGPGVFHNCQMLKFNEYDNALYLGNENNPYHALMTVKGEAEKIINCNIHRDTKLIVRGAFSFCHNLKSIEIPDSVLVIDEFAFSHCRLLKTITVPAHCNCPMILKEKILVIRRATDNMSSMEGYELQVRKKTQEIKSSLKNIFGRNK